ncbi:hypothetical protein LTR62_008430 [Meristemomyces frigidus]|uniref:Uncharacterized protein n=1 Tax=Meristemomyces frigidus TaxID=1508187 RepID=A0AAN7TKU9_9PEZI|nr:hypothetical protein LTR62_008430 [Meristemomyces frigidus]
MRRIIYGITLWAFLAASACTLSALLLPNWITYTAPTPQTTKPSSPIRVSYGLHQRCSSITGLCTPFPQYEDCLGEDRAFCSLWRSTGFLMNLSVVLELAVLVGYIVVLVGGRGAREEGWKVLGGLLGLVAMGQMVAMALVVRHYIFIFITMVDAVRNVELGTDVFIKAYLYDHDNRFFVGWELDKSWILCTVSWAVLAVDAVALVAAKFLLPKEDDYEPIPEPR